MKQNKYDIQTVPIGIGPFRLLLCEPKWDAYGHTALEMIFGLHQAQEERAMVYFLHPPKVVNSALYEMESERVQVLHPPLPVALLFRALWRADEFEQASKTRIEGWRRDILRRLHKGRVRLPKRLADWVAQETLNGKLRKHRGKAALLEHPYYQRRVVVDGLPAGLREPYNRQAEAAARKLGIAPDARIVTVHVREPGYKAGREIADLKTETRDDSARNSDIRTYFKALDYLSSEGYTVVRVGDPSMTPVSRPGVVDLATSPLRTDALDIWCLLKSEFMIGCESGPSVVAMLTGTPTLVLNATDPVSSFPLRATDIYTLKRAVDRTTGEEYSLNWLLSEEYLMNLRGTDKYEFIDNNEEEILDAVKEMRRLLQTGPAPSDLQNNFKQSLLNVALAMRGQSNYIRKWGPDGDFLGDGVISQSFVERYYQPVDFSEQVAARQRRPATRRMTSKVKTSVVK